MDEEILMKHFLGIRTYNFIKDYDLLNLELPILKELLCAIQSQRSRVFAKDENFTLNPKEYYYDKYKLKNRLEDIIFLWMFAVEDIIFYKEILVERNKRNEKELKN